MQLHIDRLDAIFEDFEKVTSKSSSLLMDVLIYLNEYFDSFEEEDYFVLDDETVLRGLRHDWTKLEVYDTVQYLSGKGYLDSEDYVHNEYSALNIKRLTEKGKKLLEDIEVVKYANEHADSEFSLVSSEETQRVVQALQAFFSQF